MGSLEVVSDLSLDKLPPGARAIGFGPITLAFAKDKLVFPLASPEEHLTVHFGPQSGILDLHHTRIVGKEHVHTPLFRIHRDNLMAMLEEFGRTYVPELLTVIRPIGPGWIAKRRLGVVVGLYAGNEAEIAKVTTVRKRKVVVDPVRYIQQVSAPEFIEDLYDLRDGQCFTLHSTKRRNRGHMIGVGFKLTDAYGRPRLFWFKVRNMLRISARSAEWLSELFKRYGQFVTPLPWAYAAPDGKDWEAKLRVEIQKALEGDSGEGKSPEKS
jgi:hypothetical protein